MNLLTLTDSYKVTHWKQYPPKTTNIYSYYESRGGLFQETVFFGLQYFLKQYLTSKITHENIGEAKELFLQHLGSTEHFNEQGWEHIVDKHGGYLPLEIKAVDEGSIHKIHSVLMTVENTDPECFWLTNYIETILSQIWYPCTVATLSREMKKLILRYLDDKSLIDFKLHDFGFRGVSSVESAGIGGLAHLVNFKGTDTLEAIVFGQKYYSEPMAGFSIPASEHSTITSWGRHREKDAMENMINAYGSGNLYACVSDSYDIYAACRDIWGTQLKTKVLAANGTLVIRPDSGVPHEVVVQCLNILGEKFGFSINSNGMKVLNPKVRLIQGDGIDYDETRNILETMKLNGWSADNVAFGMGGGLLQKINRDTQKFAFKCSSAIVDGKEIDVYKSPVTDSGKNSKRGRFNGLTTVYRNGEILKDYTLSEVRNNAST